jgi:predicted CoA-binding protein
MSSIKEAAAEFLTHRRVAVTGVSRTPGNHGSNVVYQRLKERGYDVYPVNPHAEEIDGDRCYPDLHAIPGGVEAVVIATRPERAQATMVECADLGIKDVWMHRSFGGGSVSEPAADYGREHGLTVIDGGCPLMFEPAADPGHKVIKWVCRMNGHLPRTV